MRWELGPVQRERWGGSESVVWPSDLCLRTLGADVLGSFSDLWRLEPLSRVSGPPIPLTPLVGLRKGNLLASCPKV